MRGRGRIGPGRGGTSVARRVVRRHVVYIVINNKQYAREYNDSTGGYTDHPIQEKDGKEFYTCDDGEIVYK